MGVDRENEEDPGEHGGATEKESPGLVFREHGKRE
jgi:hypothetical protein